MKDQTSEIKKKFREQRSELFRKMRMKEFLRERNLEELLSELRSIKWLSIGDRQSQHIGSLKGISTIKAIREYGETRYPEVNVDNLIDAIARDEDIDKLLDDIYVALENFFDRSVDSLIEALEKQKGERLSLCE